MAEKEEQHIAGLITGHLRETLSPEEASALEAWLAAAPENRAFFDHVTATPTLIKALDHYYKYNPAAGREKIGAEFPSLAPAGNGQPRIRSIRWWVAAAAATLIIGSGAITYIVRQNNAPAPVAAVQAPQDAAPGGFKATLTLAGGQKIDLGEAADGSLANADGAAIQKPDSGSLVYTRGGAQASMHTLSTPRGGQYRLVLPDGTAVWLNAASSITYPTLFTGKERNVTITGEAYLEVAHNESQPFMVALPKGNSLEVLGTAFNIQAYADEPTMKTTLLAGRVRYRSGNTAVLLRPGQQVAVTGNQPPEITSGGEDAIAWKQGVINLRNTDLAALSRQLARWYNIDVKLNTANPHQVFGGVINRNAQLSTVMKALSLYGIQTKLENNVLTIE